MSEWLRRIMASEDFVLFYKFKMIYFSVDIFVLEWDYRPTGVPLGVGQWNKLSHCCPTLSGTVGQLVPLKYEKVDSYFYLNKNQNTKVCV